MKSLQVSAPGFAQRKLPPFLGAKVSAVVKNFAFTEGPLDVWRPRGCPRGCGQGTGLTISLCDLRGPRRTFQRLPPGLPHLEFSDAFVGQSRVRVVGSRSSRLPPGNNRRGRRVCGKGLEEEARCQGSLHRFPFSVWSHIWKFAVPKTAIKSSCFCFALGLELGPLFEKRVCCHFKVKLKL